MRSPSARCRPSQWLLSGPWWGRMYRVDCSHATEPRRSTTCDCPPIVQIDMTPYRNSPVVSTSHGIYLRTKLYTYTIHTPDGHLIHPDTCPRFVLYTGAEGIGGLISPLYKCVLHAVHAWQPSTAPLQTGLFDWMFKLHLCLPSNKHTVCLILFWSRAHWLFKMNFGKKESARFVKQLNITISRVNFFKTQ